MPTISIIVAIDQRHAIGRNNDLLCHLPADLKYFKSITGGHSIIMGRRTFESLPKGALPNRRNIVITHNKGLHWPNVETCTSLDAALELTRDEDEVFFIGGGAVYGEAINIAGKLYITEIDHIFEGADTFFPHFDNNEWEMISKESHPVDEKHHYPYSFVVYKRK